MPGPSRRQVSAYLSGLWYARQGMFIRLSINKQNAFIALFDCRKELLGHNKAL